MARSYLEEVELSVGWDKYRTQLMWNAIALHATPSFALHKEPEVMLAHIGIMADFWGPGYLRYLIIIEENKEIVDDSPRLGLKEQFLDIMCGPTTILLAYVALNVGFMERGWEGRVCEETTWVQFSSEFLPRHRRIRAR